MAENKNLDNENLENTEVTEVTETYNEQPKNETKKSKKLLIVLIILGLLGAGGYSIYNSFISIKEQQIQLKPGKEKAPVAIKANDSGRYMDIEFGGEGNEELRNLRIQDQIKKSEEKEHLKAPYSKNVEPYLWATNVEIEINGQKQNAETMELFNIYKDGTLLNKGYIGYSARVEQDELVNPNQTEDFNEFASYVEQFDLLSNKTLTDDEVESWAKKAETITRDDKNPATVYIGALIRNLKGKNPTEASVRYLMYANRVYPDKVIGSDSVKVDITDMSKYLDTTYSGDAEKDYTICYTYKMERPKNDEYLGIVHNYVDGSYNTYQVYDVFAFSNSYSGKNTRKEGQSSILTIFHYKDISNFMIAEYGIMANNLDWDAMGLDRASYSRYKPSYTWQISPKIEEICSAYYDFVEPDVYLGEFTTRADYYDKTAKKLGKTLGEVKSAVLTYEYWALSRGRV